MADFNRYTPNKRAIIYEFEFLMVRLGIHVQHNLYVVLGGSVFNTLVTK